MEYKIIDADTVRRFTLYLHYIQGLPQKTEEITPGALAKESCLSPALVRQDLSVLFSQDRIQSVSREALLTAIARYAEPQEQNSVILVGVGKLGSALMGYAGFLAYHLDILAGFDTNPRIIKKGAFGKPVYPLDRIDEICRKLNARIGVITTPGNCAQCVGSALVACGVRAIWNFSSAKLQLPSDVMIKNESMSSTLRQLATYAAAHSSGRMDKRKNE